MSILINSLLSLVSVFSVVCIDIAINWFLLYRRQSYKDLTSALKKKQSQLEELSEKEDDDNKGTQKKIKRLNDEIAALSKSISSESFKVRMLSMAILIISNKTISPYFAGKICARLPFVPFGFITNFTHSGIETEDLRDANYQLFYWLGSMMLRDIINKFLGVEPPNLNMNAMMPQNMRVN